jgi:hypothetical protein
MTAERWIVIPGWDKFQHRDGFRQRVPTWIKDYTEQTNKDAYLELTFHQRGLLSDLRREYAATRRQLRGDTSALTRRLGQRVAEDSLQALNRAGFIAFSASAPASDYASDPAVTEEKRSTTYYNGSELRGNEQPDKQPPDSDHQALTDHARATLKHLAGATPTTDDDIPF